MLSPPDLTPVTDSATVLSEAAIIVAAIIAGAWVITSVIKLFRK